MSCTESLPPFSFAVNLPPTPSHCLPSPRPLAPSHLNWCSRELRILEENRSASFSRLREYSSSISAFRRKNSWRSCSSCSRDSDCCSKHLNCSTSCVRISAGRGKGEEQEVRLVVGAAVGPTQLTQCLPPPPPPTTQSLSSHWCKDLALAHFCHMV